MPEILSNNTTLMCTQTGSKIFSFRVIEHIRLKIHTHKSIKWKGPKHFISSDNNLSPHQRYILPKNYANMWFFQSGTTKAFSKRPLWASYSKMAVTTPPSLQHCRSCFSLAAKLGCLGATPQFLKQRKEAGDRDPVNTSSILCTFSIAD